MIVDQDYYLFIYYFSGFKVFIINCIPKHEDFLIVFNHQVQSPGEKKAE